MTARLQAALI